MDVTGGEQRRGRGKVGLYKVKAFIKPGVEENLLTWSKWSQDKTDWKRSGEQAGE